MNAPTSRWQRFHYGLADADLFVSDNGAECQQIGCGARTHGFKVNTVYGSGITTFTAFCYCCHATSFVGVTDWDGTVQHITKTMREEMDG